MERLNRLVPCISRKLREALKESLWWKLMVLTQVIILLHLAILELRLGGSHVSHVAVPGLPLHDDRPVNSTGPNASGSSG